MDDWEVSLDHPGYRCKTIIKGSCTIQIFRPDLDVKEKNKREEHAISAMECVLRDYYKRKEGQTLRN